MSSYKRFSRSYFLSTEVINLLFLVPFAFLFVYFFIDPTSNQLMAMIFGSIAAIIASQLLQIILISQLRPIKNYLNTSDAKLSISDEDFVFARNRAVDFPRRVFIINALRWTISLLIVSLPFISIAETSKSQAINFFGIVLFVAVTSILISFVAATVNINKLFEEGKFEANEKYKKR